MTSILATALAGLLIAILPFPIWYQICAAIAIFVVSVWRTEPQPLFLLLGILVLVGLFWPLFVLSSISGLLA